MIALHARPRQGFVFVEKQGWLTGDRLAAGRRTMEGGQTAAGREIFAESAGLLRQFAAPRNPHGYDAAAP